MGVERKGTGRATSTGRAISLRSGVEATGIRLAEGRLLAGSTGLACSRSIAMPPLGTALSGAEEGQRRLKSIDWTRILFEGGS